MYTTENIVFAVIGGFISFPIIKFLVLAVAEKIANDMESELEHLNVNDD
jgi:hypothetical protein